jgi:cytochrome P450
VGHARPYRRDRLAFFARCADESGAVVRCRLSGTGYLLNAPEDIRHVLVRNAANYVKARRASGGRAAYPRPHSLLTSEGAEHRRKRRALQRLFRQRLVELVVARSRVNAGRLVDSWEEGTQVQVHAAMTALAQRNILETLLGPIEEPRLAALAAASAARRRAFEGLFFSLLPFPDYVPHARNRRHRAATRSLRAAVAEEIATRRAATERRDDLLSMLMDATYEDGAELTEQELTDEVLTISLTGFDSVSEGLTWTLYLLARHPEVDVAVASEAHGGESDPVRLPVATSAVKESLRLYPPTWLYVRLAREDDRLPGGVRVPAGAKVYLCPFVVHRDARHWPEPERFNPRRFANGAADGRQRYAYFPFGGGPHVCIGETLAMSQIVTVLAEVTRRWRLELARPGQIVQPEGGLSLRPRSGLWMRPHHRC